jgi:hypothetical protein
MFILFCNMPFYDLNFYFFWHSPRQGNKHPQGLTVPAGTNCSCPYCSLIFSVQLLLFECVVYTFRSSHVSTASFALPYFLHLPSARRWLYVFCIPSHHQSVVCFTTGPEPLPKRFLHGMRYNSSVFNFHYPSVYSRSSSTCLRLLPRLPFIYVFSSIFPLMTCLRRQTVPIQLIFFIYYFMQNFSLLLYST